jgi:hypothetical protein
MVSLIFAAAIAGGAVQLTTTAIIIGGILAAVADAALAQAFFKDRTQDPISGDTERGKQIKTSASAEGQGLTYVLGRARVPMRLIASQNGWRLQSGDPDKHTINFAVDVCNGPVNTRVVKSSTTGYDETGFIEAVYAEGQPIYLQAGEVTYSGPDLYFLSCPRMVEAGANRDEWDAYSSRVLGYNVSRYKLYKYYDGVGYSQRDIPYPSIQRPIVVVSPPWGPSLSSLLPVGEEVTLHGVPIATYTPSSPDPAGVTSVTFDPNIDGQFFGRSVDQRVPSGSSDDFYDDDNALDTQNHDQGAPGYQLTYRVAYVTDAFNTSVVGTLPLTVFSGVSDMTGWEVASLELYPHRNVRGNQTDDGAWKYDWRKRGVRCTRPGGSPLVAPNVSSRSLYSCTASDGVTSVYPGVGRDIALSAGKPTLFQNAGAYPDDYRAADALVVPGVPLSRSGKITYLDPYGNVKTGRGIQINQNYDDTGFHNVTVKQTDVTTSYLPVVTPPPSTTNPAYLDSSAYDPDNDGITHHNNNFAEFVARFPPGVVPSNYTEHYPVAFGIVQHTTYPVDGSTVKKGMEGTLSTTLGTSGTQPFAAMYQISGSDTTPTSDVRNPSTPVGAVLAELFGQPSASGSTNPNISSWVPNRVGRAWVVFKDMDLVNFGDRIPNMEAVVVEREDLDLATAIGALLERHGIKPWQYDVSEVTGELDGLAVVEPVGSIETIQALMEVYRIDAREVDSKLHFSMREDAPTYALDYGELGAGESTERVEPINVTVLPTSAAPKVVQVKFMEDGAGLIINAVTVTSDGSGTVFDRTKTEKLQYPFAMTRRRANLAALQELVDRQLELEQYSFAIPPTRLDIRDSDCFSTVVDADDSSFEIVGRITEIERGANFYPVAKATKVNPSAKALPIDLIPEEGASGTFGGGGDAGGGQPPIDQAYIPHPVLASWNTVGYVSGGTITTEVHDINTPQATVAWINPGGLSPNQQLLETDSDEERATVASSVIENSTLGLDLGYPIVAANLYGSASADSAQKLGLDPTLYAAVSAPTNYLSRHESIIIEDPTGSFRDAYDSLDNSAPSAAEASNSGRYLVIGTEIISWSKWEISGSQVTLSGLQRGVGNTNAPTTLVYSADGDIIDYTTEPLFLNPLSTIPRAYIDAGRRVMFTVPQSIPSEELRFEAASGGQGGLVEFPYYKEGVAITIGGDTLRTRIYSDSTFTRRPPVLVRPAKYFQYGSEYGCSATFALTLRSPDPGAPESAGCWPRSFVLGQLDSFPGVTGVLRDSANAPIAIFRITGTYANPTVSITSGSEIGLQVEARGVGESSTDGTIAIRHVISIIVKGVSQEFSLMLRETEQNYGASCGLIVT